MRQNLLVANWKMNLELRSAEELAQNVRAGFSPELAARIDVALCPPFPYLRAIAAVVSGSPIAVGAQNCSDEPSGAFTGEVSAGMLADCGCRMVILGHSERRHTIGTGEDDYFVSRKIGAALAAGLTPIICVGETSQQRQRSETLAVLTFQVRAALAALAVGAVERLVFAYEPVWAIGTGQNATPEQAQEAHGHIRAELRAIAPDTADDVRILYGGSVKPQNAAELMRQPDVDGGLIGGASLDAKAFLEIAVALAGAAISR